MRALLTRLRNMCLSSLGPWLNGSEEKSLSNAPSSWGGILREGFPDSFISRSLRAAAFAAAICSRRADDDDFAAAGAGALVVDAATGFSFFWGGANALPNAGRAFVGLAASVLLGDGLDGDVGPGDGGTIDLEL